MKIFIAGARSITAVDQFIQNKLHSICQKEFDVLVGDCYGVDTAVQSFFAAQNYERVTVYASNGLARNNLGHWNTKNIRVDSNNHGFNFFRQKDIAMANDADYGFMIWDGESKGTLHNIFTLAEKKKTVLVYFPKHQKHIAIHSLAEAEKLMMVCNDSAKSEYRKLMKRKSIPVTETPEQLSMLSQTSV